MHVEERKDQISGDCFKAMIVNIWNSHFLPAFFFFFFFLFASAEGQTQDLMQARLALCH